MTASTSSTGASTCRRTAGSTSTRTRSATSATSFTVDGPFDGTAASRSRARSRPRTPTASCAARSSAFRRACICARPPLTQLDPAIAELRARRARSRPAATRSAMLHLLLDRLHDDMTFDTEPDRHDDHGGARPSRSSAASARTSRHIFIAAARSLGVPARYVGGHFHRSDGVDRSRRPATPGPRRSCPVSAGSRSIPPTASARPRPMCGSRSGSTIWARRRSAAPARAAARRRWRSPSTWRTAPGRRRAVATR